MVITKEQALTIIQKYIGNIGNNPAIREDQETCADLLTNGYTERTPLSIAMTIHMSLRNPHNRQDLRDAYNEITREVLNQWCVK